MSIVDKLLQTDARTLTELPSGKFEIKRLSERLGTKFELTLSAVPSQKYSEIQKAGIELSKKGGVREIKLFDMQALTLLEGVKEPNLKDAKLREHFHAATPKELISKLFLAGEISEIYAKIQELSGYEADDEETEKEIKN